MTGATRTPAQAAGAGVGAAPASPPSRPMCGAKNRNGGRCGLGRGFGTEHPGSGRCKFHGGNSPNGKAYAQREQVKATLEALAIPVEGDPLEVLQAAVEAAHGVLLAGRELLKAGATEQTLKIYLEGIERAARVAKSAAEAVNLDELVRIREREADILEAALGRALDRFGIADDRRPEFLTMFREELSAALPAGGELN